MAKTRHDGDCWIYAANGVCTCGFLHEILPNADTGEWEKYKADIIKHETNLHYLNGIEVPKAKPVSDEEFEKEMKKS